MKRIVPEYTIIVCNGLCPHYISGVDNEDVNYCRWSDEWFSNNDKAPSGVPCFCELKEV